jgi:hypothetical protein
MQDGAVADGQGYEDAVLRRLARHGGRLERRLRSIDGVTEAQIIRFVSPAALDAFMTDPERLACEPPSATAPPPRASCTSVTSRRAVNSIAPRLEGRSGVCEPRWSPVPANPDRPAEPWRIPAGLEARLPHRRLCAVSTMTHVDITVAEPGTSFIGALSRAYRYADRDGIAVAGTDLVLCALRFQAPAVGRNVSRPPPWGRVWRPVRYYRTGLDDPVPPPRTRLAPRFDGRYLLSRGAAEHPRAARAFRPTRWARSRPANLVG